MAVVKLRPVVAAARRERRPASDSIHLACLADPQDCGSSTLACHDGENIRAAACDAEESTDMRFKYFSSYELAKILFLKSWMLFFIAFLTSFSTHLFSKQFQK